MPNPNLDPTQPQHYCFLRRHLLPICLLIALIAPLFISLTVPLPDPVSGTTLSVREGEEGAKTDMGPESDHPARTGSQSQSQSQIPIQIQTQCPNQNRNPNQNPNRAQWTCIVYVALDNNLDDYPVDGTDMILDELKRIGSRDDVNIVALVDGHRHLNDLGHTELFYVRPHRLEELPLSAINATWTNNELNTGDGAVLTQFLTWSADAYPAERYFIQMVDHGGGWKGQCWDDTSDDKITLEEWRTALATFTQTTGAPVDLICFAECLMAQLEVYHATAPYADILIGSEEVVTPTIGYEYAGLRAFMDHKSDENGPLAVEIVNAMLDVYRRTEVTIHLSVLDCAHAAPLVEAVDDLAKALIAADAVDALRTVRERVQEFGTWGQSNYQVVDLLDLAQLLRQRSITTEIDTIADTIIETLSKTVLCSQHYNGLIMQECHVERAHGLAIDFHRDGVPEEYPSVPLANSTAWDELLQYYAEPDQGAALAQQLGVAPVDTSDRWGRLVIPVIAAGVAAAAVTVVWVFYHRRRTDTMDSAPTRPERK